MSQRQRPVLTTVQARTKLSAILRTFRSEGEKASPVLFGDRRRAEGVILSMALWERIEAAADLAGLFEDTGEGS